MKYLSSIFIQNGGICRPLIHSYTDSDGKPRPSTNISISSYKGDIISNTRLANYIYIPVSATDKIMCIHFSSNVSSYNAIGQIDSDKLVYEILGKNKFTWGPTSFTGLEDIRLVVWNDILYGIGFRPDVINGKVITQLIEYNDDFTINRSWFINTNKGMEKNWQPVEDKPFTFIYDPDKSVLLTLNIDNLQIADDNNMPTVINEIQTPDFTYALSGSSQVIKLDDERYISICHTSHRYIGNDLYTHWVYNHYFVVYDKDMNKIWVSEPFRFVSDCMEFTCGMCKHNGDLCISFSMYDGVAHLLSIPVDKFLDILTTMMNDTDAYEGEPNNEYMVQCYNSNKVSDHAAFTYMMFLESIHKLDNIDAIDNVLYLSSFDNRSFSNAILLYFITRRTDCNFLLKKLT